MTNRKTFLDPEADPNVATVAALMDELRPLQGERLADAEEIVADMATRDQYESSRRLRSELLRTVASTQPIQAQAGADPEDLRRALFAAAWEAGTTGATEANLFALDRESVLEAVAARFGIATGDVGLTLFADTPGERRLLFPVGDREAVAREAIRTINAERLRERLRDAVALSLHIPARSPSGPNYVRLLWNAKRLGLMYDATQSGPSITIDLLGPYALFARTTMYGNRLFEFAREIIEHAGKDWKLRIDLLSREGKGTSTIRSFWLDASARGLFFPENRIAGVSVRSGDEEAFHKYFLKLSSEWQLDYEGALIPLQGKGRSLLMVPDFVARRPNTSVEVLIEIVGFWKTEYLNRKIEKVRLLGNRRLILVVNSKLSVSREDLVLPENDLVRVYFYSGREELKRVVELVMDELRSIV